VRAARARRLCCVPQPPCQPSGVPEGRTPRGGLGACLQGRARVCVAGRVPWPSSVCCACCGPCCACCGSLLVMPRLCARALRPCAPLWTRGGQRWCLIDERPLETRLVTSDDFLSLFQVAATEAEVGEESRINRDLATHLLDRLNNSCT
jgi:hypothetical protein